MLSGYDAEELSSIEAEDALADEFCEWVRSWQTVPAEGSTPGRVVSGARLSGLLGIGRIRIMSVMNNRLRGERGWRQANQLVRQGWLANRERWLLMGLAELEMEEEERKRKKEAAALGAEAEVHDDDAPYATAADGGLQPASGVSDENIDTGSTPLAGRPREIEQAGEPDEDADASQPGAVLSDAEVPDDATQAIVPADAPDVTAVMPVAPAETRLTPASVQSPVNAPVPFDDPPAALGDASAGAPVAGAPTGEAEAGVPAPGAYNENAPAEGDAAATDDADAADWGENAAVCVTEGASEEVRLSLTGGPPPVGLDFEDMIALIGARNAERCGQEAFSIELHCKVSDTAAPRSPSGAMSV